MMGEVAGQSCHPDVRGSMIQLLVGIL